MTKQEFDEKYVYQDIEVHCETKELNDEFLELANSFGYVVDSAWDWYEDKVCYNVRYGSCCSLRWCLDNKCDVIEFKSLKDVKKEKDMRDLRGLLEVGSVVELRNGIIGILLDNKIITQNGWVNLSNDWYSNDLKSKRGNERRGWDVAKIYDCPTINDSTWNFANDDRSLLKLVWERKEFNVSEDEKPVLKLIPKKYKYITRDRSSELFIHMGIPQKTESEWDSHYDIGCLDVFGHLFDYIKWEDEKPVKIADLLNS